jgi:hypothetical protein
MSIIEQTHFLIECKFEKPRNKTEAVPMTPHPTDWYVLAEQASMEADPNKLMAIVELLNSELEREETFRRMPRKAGSN